MAGLPDLIAALSGSAAAAPKALDTQRHHAAENSGRSATAWTTLNSAGTGTFSPPDAFHFDVAFVDKPAFYYGVECTDALPEGADAPLTSGYVSGWVTDPDGHFIGAYLTANVSEAPLTVMLTHHFTFSGVAIKTLTSAASVPGVVTPTTDATQLPANPIVEASNNPQAPSKGTLHATLAQAQETLAQAQADIDAKISYGTVPPSDATPGTPGSVYYVQSGDPLEVTEQYQCTAGTGTDSGNVWQRQKLNAAQLVVPGTVEAVHLAVTQDVTGKSFIGGTFTGQRFIGAEFKTDTAGRRMEVGHNSSGGVDPSNVAFYNGFTGETPAIIGPYGGEVGGNPPTLAFLSPIQSSASNRTEVDVIAGSTALTLHKDSVSDPKWLTEPRLTAYGNLLVSGDAYFQGKLRQGNDSIGTTLGIDSTYASVYGGAYDIPGYSRHGDIVICSGLLSIDAAVSGSGVWLVSGLPKPRGGKIPGPFSCMGNAGGTRSYYLNVNIVSGVWCVVTGESLSSGWISISNIIYTAD